jgi:hypothetical protein
MNSKEDFMQIFGQATPRGMGTQRVDVRLHGHSWVIFGDRIRELSRRA